MQSRHSPYDNTQPAMLPNFCLTLGCIGTFLFGGLIILCIIAITTESAGGSIIFSVALSAFFFASSLLMLIAYINCRIWYDEHTILVKNIWGIKHEYTYRDITGRCGDFKEPYLFLGNKKLEISSPSRMTFFHYACSRYEELYGRAVPFVDPDEYARNILFKEKAKIFGVYIFMFVMVAFLFATLLWK